MYCRRCGAKLPEGSTVCSVCGTRTVPDRTKTAARPTADRKTIMVRRIVALLLLVLLIAGAALLIWMRSPSQRYKKAMEAAQEHLLAGEEREAADSYRQALAAIPDDETAAQGLYDLWNSVLESSTELLDTGRYEEALERAADLDGIDPERGTMNHAAVLLTLREWAAFYAKNGDSQGVQEVLAKAEEHLTAEEIADIRKTSENTIELKNSTDKLDGLSAEIVSAVGEEDLIKAFSLMNDMFVETAHYFDLGGEYPYRHRAGQRGTLFLAEDDMMQFTIGEIDQSGQPGGYVTVLFSQTAGSPDAFYCWYTTEWSSGAPNGYTECHEMGSILEDKGDDALIKGMVMSGYWDGEIQRTSYGGETYTLTYDKGKVKVLQRVGDDQNIVGYNADGSMMIIYSDDSVSRAIGIMYLSN